MKEFLALGGTGVLILLMEILNLKKWATPVLLAGLSVTVLLAVQHMGVDEDVFGMARMDTMALSFCTVICLVTMAWYLLFKRHFESNLGQSDLVALIVFSLIGGLCMVSFTNLTMLFLGIEILSISLYVLAASDKSNINSTEAGFKYFLMGAFASGFLLFGIAMIYGATGSFDIYKIGEVLGNNRLSDTPLVLVGITMIIVGLGFKASGAPFHFWAPDVYQGSPTPITAYMATVVKTVAFAAFFRLFYISFQIEGATWLKLIWGMTALTLVLGNLTAAVQENAKRMLAYSSIGHAGFLLMALAAMNEKSYDAILFYGAAYSLSTVAAFGVLYFVQRSSGGNNLISAFNGLGKRNPGLALVMTIALLSLGGIPPLAGFMAKYFAFAAAFTSGHIWLPVIGIIGSLIGIYYYFKLIIAMYFAETEITEAVEVNGLEQGLLYLLTVLMVVLGVFPWLVTGGF